MSSTAYSSLPPYIGDGDGDTTILSRTASRTQSLFVTRRPWRELLAHPSSYSLPRSFADLAARLKRNLTYFRVNYAMVVLLVLFLSLLYHPISMIIFVVVFIFWFLLYFFRDEPIVVFRRVVDDRLVLTGLGIVTVIGLLFTGGGVWINVLVSILVGAAVVVLHAVFRVTEDLFMDEEEAAAAGMLSVVGAKF